MLDASAVLAWLRAEAGVHQKLAQHGVDADRTRLRTLGVRVEPFDDVDAVTAAKLRFVQASECTVAGR